MDPGRPPGVQINPPPSSAAAKGSINMWMEQFYMFVYTLSDISGLLSVLSYLSHLLNCTFSLDELIRNADLGSVIFWLWTLVDGWQQKSHFHPTKSPKDFN